MKTISKITKRQKQFLEAIYSSIETEGYPPTFEDLKHKFNISSNQAVIDHLESLENKGLIKREEKSARGIKILPLGYRELGVNNLIPMEGISYAGG
ncbi:repressor LexA, partial [Patescibacteria group bacterium]|nr:repressor LexA [Patescibacteria group bacterium]